MQGFSRPRLAVAAVAASAASLGGLAFGAAPANAASTITVGPGGSYPTIAAGMAAAHSGDTVQVANGVYNETLDAKAGVKVVSATHGGAQVTNINVTGAANSTVDGFKVAGYVGTAIKVSNSDGSVISNNVVSGSGQASNDATLPTVPPIPPVGSNGLPAVSLSGAVTFSGNHIFNSTYYGVTVSGAGGTKVLGNEVDHNADTNSDPAARFASGISVKAPNVVVAGNYSHDNQDSGLQFYGGPTGGDNGVAINNVIANNGDHGIDNLNVTGGKVVNNTVVGNLTAGINVEGTSSSYTVANNIAADNGTSASPRSKGDIRVAQGATAPGATVVDHNLVSQSTAGNYLYNWDLNNGTSIPGNNRMDTTVAQFRTDSGGQGMNDAAGAPGFVGATDYHVTAGSPAAGLGAAALRPSGFPNDKDGNAWNGAAGAYNAGSSGGPVVTPGTGPSVRRLQGLTRYQTGVAISQQAYGNSSVKDVLIATGVKFPDALAGVPLAKHLGAPLLLVDPTDTTATGANAVVKTEIARVLQAGGTVHVLGGVAAVPDSLKAALTPSGAGNDRIAGATRWETSVAIAGKMGNPKNVVVARGDDGVNQTGFADALSAGPYAADVFGGGDAAVLLSNNTTLDASVKNYLATATSIQAVGGPANTAVGSGANVKPAIVGGTRYETAAKVADQFGTSEKTAGVAFGLKFPDALTGAAFLAKADGPLLLSAADSVDATVVPRLAGIGQTLGTGGTIWVFGGPAAISEVGRAAIATAAGGSLA